MIHVENRKRYAVKKYIQNSKIVFMLKKNLRMVLRLQKVELLLYSLQRVIDGYLYLSGLRRRTLKNKAYLDRCPLER